LRAAAVATVLALCSFGVASASGAQLTWARPVLHHSGLALTCPSAAPCLAVSDGSTPVSLTAALNAPWSSSVADDFSHHLTAIFCPSATLCFADTPKASSGLAPVQTGGSFSFWPQLNGLSCPSAALCIAIEDAGTILASTNPASAPSWWTTMKVDGGTDISAVSCPTARLCAAVDDAGHIIVSTNPASASSWRVTALARASLTAVSCTSSGLCVAVAADGSVYATADAFAPPVTWSLTPLPGPLSAVSCSDAGLCAVVDRSGRVGVSDNATADRPTWTSTALGHSGLAGVTCLASGFCVAVNDFGDTMEATLPAPTVVTGGGTVSSQTTATLGASVNPNDATLTNCHFDYGLTNAYGMTVACQAEPSANGGTQSVSAPISGLTAGATYHFRIVAASGVADPVGADTVFATPAPLKANPSLSGAPWMGSVLTCNTNVTTAPPEKVSYVWLRDTVPISGETTATHVIAAPDTTHYLSCQVTISGDGGSTSTTSGLKAISAQVEGNITTSYVGAAQHGSASARAPVTCSPQAAGSCTIQLLLKANEIADDQRQTVVAGSSTTTLDAGTTRTLTVSLNVAGRHLLKQRRRLAVMLTVRGTVIGTLTAKLQVDRLVFSGTVTAARIPPSTAVQAPSTAALATTPYMGWDTYFALAGGFPETAILQQADRLKTSGLEAKGYKLIWLDAGWWQGQRDPAGNMVVSAKQWPHGIAWLAATLHANGFELGVYTDAGATGCGEAGGAYGHYQQDINTLASWGVDAVKVDWCGGFKGGLNPATAYAQIHAAILNNSSHRPMLLSICNFLQPGQKASGIPSFHQSAYSSYSFSPSDGNSWRTATDVGVPGDVPFGNVLRNLDSDATSAPAAGPGHWNDPDYLAPDQGMTAAQFQTQFSMWAILAAPLMISDNLLTMSRASLATVSNRQVVAVDQDPAGVQGTLVSGSSSGNGEVWIKPLFGGSYAVALLNRGASALPMATTAAALKLPAARSYEVTNLWTNQHSTTTSGFTAMVGAYSTVLLRVSAH